MKDFRKALETLCEHFHDLYHDHEKKTHRGYYEMYYEIICGYLATEKDLRPLIVNMVKQIDIRQPWSHGAENEVLNHVRAELLLVMKKDPLIKQIASNSSIY